ncbi:hypothetical protein HCJ99_26440, partial [Streptomyces sp. C1-2]|nr:hypothetical protein [Streptomyces sp. C1-2]
MDTPILIGSPPREADCYQERSASQRLSQAFESIDATPEVCLLVGVGGVGKTQIAARYVRERLSNRSVDVVVWASASSREAIQSSYAKAINALTGADISDTESAAANFLSWTHITDMKWLVVLDDLSTPSVIRELCPPSIGSGRVLITTRRRDSALAGAKWHRIPVEILSAGESVEYLTQKLGAFGLSVESRELENLAEDLGYLPLALAQSAAYLVDAGMECTQYRELLADRRGSLRELLPDAESLPDDHLDIVTATWSLSMEKANSLTPRGLARPVLEIAAVLNPNGIPRLTFETAAIKEYVSSFMDASGQKALIGGHINSALRNLHRLSLIDDDAGATPGAEVRMHALVQRAVVETLSEEAYAITVQVAADGLLEAWPSSPIQSDYVRAFRSNAEFMRDNSLPQLLSDYSHEILDKYGESLMAAGLASVAVSHFEMLRRAIEEDDPTRPDLTYLRLCLGDALEESGRIAEALTEYRKLLHDELKRDDGDDGWVQDIRSSLAECLGRAGDAEGSVRAFEELLKERIRVHGPDDELTFDTRRRLVSARSHAGDIAGAIATCQELLEDELRVNGQDHAATWHTQIHLAEEIGASGDTTAAIEILENMLRQVSRQHGDHHEETFSIRHHLAQWYAEDKRYEEAISITRSLVHDEETSFGETHPSVLELL